MSNTVHAHAGGSRSFTISPALVRTLLTILEFVCITVGPAVLAFNIFNFNLAKNGFYYKDAAQWGIAIGIFMIALAYVLRRK